MEQALHFPILSTLIFFPILGGILVLLISRTREKAIKTTALAVGLVTVFLCIPLFTAFDPSTAAMQFRETYPWIPAWGISYAAGVDGISVLFIGLSALLTVLCVLVSWESIREKAKEFYAALLFIEGALIGVFCSLDLFLFYIFWEAMLIPLFLLIGVWGGPNRRYAAIKFFLYTLVGSVLMLVGIIVLYLHAGKTSHLLDLLARDYPYGLQVMLFWAFFAAFAVKVPMVPVHTWLPDAHTEAPTAGSVILAGVLIKMGAYGFLRFSIPLFPEATKAMAPALMVLSVVAIIYGGLICLGQTDLKRLIAYSSVSHMGFVTLGIFALNTQGLQGGILQMINHGIVTGALFLCVGMLYDRTHTRQIADYGGAAAVLPLGAACFLVFTLASIGLPGTNGFIGEFLIIVGGFTASKTLGALASTGIIIGAAYMLWLYQRLFFQDTNARLQGLRDFSLRELAAVAPLLVLVVWIGVYPNTLLGCTDAPVRNLVERLDAAGANRTARHAQEVIR